MKRLLCVFMVLIFAASCAMIVFADGIDGPKTVGCGTPASTTPADWAKEDVEKALEIGILDADKTYYFGSFITREEFCEIIYNLVNNKLDLTNGYKDVKSDIFVKKPISEISIKDTDTKAVFELIRSGIINGKKVEIREATNLIEPSTDVIKYHYDVTFNPDDLLIREEAATIISRVLELYPDISYTEMYFEYDDEKDISDWAKEAVQKLSNAKIMEGYGGGVFYPKSHLSTEEAVVMLIRVYELIPNAAVPKNASFADKLNAQMPTDKNYMFSPLSIKMALAMAANGAEGETREELLDILKVNNIQKYNEFSKELIERYTQSDKLTLNIANAVWVNTDNSPYDFKEGYKETVSEFYNAEAGKVNNKNAAKTINGWVNEKTKGKIPSIIEDSDFWAALVNAIYFKGSWEKDFDKKRTKPDIFTSADGTKTEIDFMNQTDSFSYHKSDDAEIVKLRYKTSFFTEDKDGKLNIETVDGMNVSMYLIKTDSTDIENIIKTSYDYERIALSVPKFKVEYSKEITKLLELEFATDKSKADFSGMMNLSPNDSLWIDKVLHRTYISVDEEGTEAAAVTAVMMNGATSAKPKEPIEVKFDEPFYFVIRDDTNGEILFMGRYAYAE